MNKFKPVKAAIIGCGVISGTYLNNCCKRFNILDIVGCSDIIPERSARRAAEYGIKQMTNEEILSNPEIELVINLTYPTAHYDVSKQILNAGKNLYTEKMLAPTFEKGKELVALAESKGLLFGSAPDTFLGSGMQTARAILDADMIGRPVAANAILIRSYRHERFAVNDDRMFVFKPGAGILFDVGCYYLTTLVNLLGPVKRVTGFSQTIHTDEKIYMNPANPHYGELMKVEDAPNNSCGVLEFESGVLCPILTTSEAGNFTNHFEIYGMNGKLTLIDPNTFSGAVYVSSKTGGDTLMPNNHSFDDDCRGLGTADLCYALRNGREPRADMHRALHTLEIASTVIANTTKTLETSCTRAQPIPAGYSEYPEMALDL